MANFEFSINVKGLGFAKNANCASKSPFYVGAFFERPLANTVRPYGMVKIRI